ncbi:helix-turn-helix transcriptional regulator [Gordonia hongkongensis]|uniref:helix-turn-helix transcriptional regulator n=1 Tax=Gordonia hongkongensis TaxID=1701090 RepID=UPI003D723693
MTQKQFLTTLEVAELTGIPTGTLRYWRHRGEGPPSFRLGRRVVYRAERLWDWIDAQESKLGA